MGKKYLKNICHPGAPKRKRAAAGNGNSV